MTFLLVRMILKKLAWESIAKMKLDSIFEALPDGVKKIVGHETIYGGEHIPEFVRKWVDSHKDMTAGATRWASMQFDPENGTLSHVIAGRWVTIANITSNEDLPPFKFGEIGRLEFHDCKFSDISFLPEKVRALSFMESDVPSIKGISKIVKSCEEIVLSPKMKSGLLELLSLNGLKKISLSRTVKFSDEPIGRAAFIVAEHLEGEKDIIDCQSELIDNDLESFC